MAEQWVTLEHCLNSPVVWHVHCLEVILHAEGPRLTQGLCKAFFFLPVGRITNELPSSTAEQQRSASFFSDIKKCLAGVWITGLTGFCFHYSSSKFASRGIISILFLGVIQFYFRKHKLSLLLTYILINCVFMSTYRAWFTS